MSRYLEATGRKEISYLAQQVREHLTADPGVYDRPGKYFDQIIEINLSELEPYINGPFTPDLATPVSEMKEVAARNGWPLKIDVGLIGSCTNSSYEDISRAASVAADALKKNLTAKSQFTITPGSEQIRSLAERDGYLAIFEKLGGRVFANACGPCIGQWDREGADREEVNSVVHSFNRNFARRNDGNPNTHAFIASPEITTALVIAGDLTFNPVTDSLININGEEVRLAEPAGFDLPPDGFMNIATGLQKPSGNRDKVKIKIDPASERLQALEPFPAWDGNDLTGLPLLIKVKGKCTTDHISMAGFWLRYRGHLDKISDNYMIGAVNAFNDKTNSILNQVTRQYEPVPRVARFYKSEGMGSVVVGEENFGEGSSREHAAMEPRFLNVRVVLVKSFARIHETNLKKQGLLALTFADRADYNRILEGDRIDIVGLDALAPGRQVKINLNHAGGDKEVIYANHSYNDVQIEWFRAGSALNLISRKNRKNNIHG
jgi:aconitate hydratase